MKAIITNDCIACRLCVETCPQVFEMDDTIAKVIVDSIPQEDYVCAQQAANECPVEAIIIE